MKTRLKNNLKVVGAGSVALICQLARDIMLSLLVAIPLSIGIYFILPLFDFNVPMGGVIPLWPVIAMIVLAIIAFHKCIASMLIIPKAVSCMIIPGAIDDSKLTESNKEFRKFEFEYNDSKRRTMGRSQQFWRKKQDQAEEWIKVLSVCLVSASLAESFFEESLKQVFVDICFSPISYFINFMLFTITIWFAFFICSFVYDLFASDDEIDKAYYAAKEAQQV